MTIHPVRAPGQGPFRRLAASLGAPAWLRGFLGRSPTPTRPYRPRKLDERGERGERKSGRQQELLFHIYQELLDPATVIVGASELRIRLGEGLSDGDRHALDVAVYEQSLKLARLLGALEVGLKSSR